MTSHELLIVYGDITDEDVMALHALGLRPREGLYPYWRIQEGRQLFVVKSGQRGYHLVPFYHEDSGPLERQRVAKLIKLQDLFQGRVAVFEPITWPN